MTELVEFLKARIAEDEEYAQRRRDEAESEANEGRVTVYRWLSGGGGKLHDDPIVNLADSRRWLAEVNAKRRIIEDYRIARSALDQTDSRGSLRAGSDAFFVACLALASVYSDHPDFDQLWAA